MLSCEWYLKWYDCSSIALFLITNLGFPELKEASGPLSFNSCLQIYTPWVFVVLVLIHVFFQPPRHHMAESFAISLCRKSTSFCLFLNLLSGNFIMCPIILILWGNVLHTIHDFVSCLWMDNFCFLSWRVLTWESYEWLEAICCSSPCVLESTHNSNCGAQWCTLLCSFQPAGDTSCLFNHCCWWMW